jgi:hypothetical protein
MVWAKKRADLTRPFGLKNRLGFKIFIVWDEIWFE